MAEPCFAWTLEREPGPSIRVVEDTVVSMCGACGAPLLDPGSRFADAPLARDDGFFLTGWPPGATWAALSRGLELRHECSESISVARRVSGTRPGEVRAPQGALGLFAARRRPADRASSPSWRPHTAIPALGLTDTNNLFGALEFSDKLGRRRHPADHRRLARRRFRGAQARSRPSTPPGCAARSRARRRRSRSSP